MTTLLVGFAAVADAAEDDELQRLFTAHAGRDDEEACRKLRALGDDAVDFLCGVIIAKEQHPVEYHTVDGLQKTTGTWSQDACGILAGIDTPKVVTEARKLATHKDPDVRFWGINQRLAVGEDRRNMAHPDRPGCQVCVLLGWPGSVAVAAMDGDGA